MLELLGTSDIAQMYHVTNATVLNWIHAGKLKAFTTPGGHYRISREDLSEFARAYNAAAQDTLRLLLVGADTEYYSRLRSAVLFRWPAAQIEHACTEFEIGWWLARLSPTHIVVHPTLTVPELHYQCQELAGGKASRDVRLLTLPDSLDDGLGRWIDRLDYAVR
jgi:excisionase family DNA binding protein